MEAIEALLMDMLDDGPNSEATLVGANSELMDESLAADMMRMHQLSPLLQQCKLPVNAADESLLESIRLEVSSNVQRSAYLKKFLWSSAGAVVGGLTIWYAATQLNLPSDAPPSPAKHSPTVTVAPRQTPIIGQPNQSTPAAQQNGSLKVRQNTAELVAERDRMANTAALSKDDGAYRAYRDLYHMNMAIEDTSAALGALRMAHYWATQIGDSAGVQRCAADINGLTQGGGR